MHPRNTGHKTASVVAGGGGGGGGGGGRRGGRQGQIILKRGWERVGTEGGGERERTRTIYYSRTVV